MKDVREELFQALKASLQTLREQSLKIARDNLNHKDPANPRWADLSADREFSDRMNNLFTWFRQQINRFWDELAPEAGTISEILAIPLDATQKPEPGTVRELTPSELDAVIQLIAMQLAMELHQGQHVGTEPAGVMLLRVFRSALRLDEQAAPGQVLLELRRHKALQHQGWLRGIMNSKGPHAGGAWLPFPWVFLERGDWKEI